MSLYGYDKKTTPFLLSLMGEEGFYRFDAIAPSNQTRYSIPMYYTDANVSNWRYGFVHSHAIFARFSHAGYTTYWLSNQGKIGKWNDFITSVAEETDKQIFLNPNDYVEPKKDIALYTYLYRHDLPGKNRVFLIHLLGSHVDYKKRYDQTHALIKKACTPVEHYDNTIFYTDFVIGKLFAYFLSKKDKTLIVYLSDHGEIVDNDSYGHGRLPPYKKDEYEIPFVVYSTISNKCIEKLVSLNRKHYLNLENFNTILTYLCGITDKVQPSYSSKVLTVSPKHLYSYDTLPYFKKVTFRTKDYNHNYKNTRR